MIRLKGTPSPSGGPREAATPETDRSEIHGDVLRLEELLEALVAALASDAALLHAAEGGARVRDHALVQADHSGLEALAHADRSLDVAGEDVGDEPVLGVVGLRDRLLLGVEAAHRRHGAEDLLVEDARVLGHVAQDGRLDEVAATVRDLAADHLGRALRERVLDQL